MGFWRRLWAGGLGGKIFAVFVSLLALAALNMVWEHAAANGIVGERAFTDLQVKRVAVSRGRSTSYRAVGIHEGREIKVSLWQDEAEAIKVGDVLQVVTVPGSTTAYLRRGVVAYDPNFAVPVLVLLLLFGGVPCLAFLAARFFKAIPRFSRNHEFIDRSVVRRVGER